ncbi:MAG: hypothetical protein IJH04_07550 [Eggerthellaceae bacterium]|nr:hypothetical protein [Eggerthellaceae bacterium]
MPMAKCFYCCHCGKCGPSSYDPYKNPPGYCPFCGATNDVVASQCAQCGKPLPRPAGATKSEAGSNNGEGAQSA